MFMPFGNNEAGRSLYRLVVPLREEKEWEISKDKSSFKLTIFTIFNHETQKSYYGARVSVNDAALVANPAVSRGHITDLLFTHLEALRGYLHDVNNILLFELDNKEIDKMVNTLKEPSGYNYSLLKAQWREEYTESGVFAKCTDWFYFDMWNITCLEATVIKAQRQWLFNSGDIEKFIDKIDAELYVLRFPSTKITQCEQSDSSPETTDVEDAGQYRVVSYNPHALTGLNHSDTGKRLALFDYQIHHSDGELMYYGARVAVWNNSSCDSTVLFDVLFATKELQQNYLNRIKEGFNKEGSFENNTEVNNLKAIRSQWFSEFVLVEYRRRASHGQFTEWLHTPEWVLTQVTTDFFYIPNDLGSKNLCPVHQELLKNYVELDYTYVVDDDLFWGTLCPMTRFIRALVNLSVALDDLTKNRKFIKSDIFVVFYEQDGKCYIEVIPSFDMGITYKIRVGELEDKAHYLSVVNEKLIEMGFTHEQIGADLVGSKLAQITEGKVESNNVFFFVKPSTVTQETVKEEETMTDTQPANYSGEDFAAMRCGEIFDRGYDKGIFERGLEEVPPTVDNILSGKYEWHLFCKAINTPGLDMPLAYIPNLQFKSTPDHTATDDHVDIDKVPSLQSLNTLVAIYGAQRVLGTDLTVHRLLTIASIRQ